MSVRIIKILLVIIFSIPLKYGQAQDIHFSQNNLTPLLLNPANTGDFPGNWRLSNIFRSQWKSFAEPGYQTVAVGYDQLRNDLFDGLSLGGILIHDRAGSVTMSVTKILISGAVKRIYGRNIITGGIQTGLVMKQFDNATYGNQFDWSTGSINPGLPSLETGIDESIRYLDFNAGFHWKRKVGRFEPELGISFFHLNNPKERFTEYAGRMRIRSMYSLGCRIITGERLYIHPVIYYQSIQRSENLLGGVEFRYNLEMNPSHVNYLTLGTLVRSGFNRQTDAAVFSLGISVSKFIIGFSFDANISEIQAYTNSKGAFEIGIIYTGFTKAFNPGSLPCSRE